MPMTTEGPKKCRPFLLGWLLVQALFPAACIAADWPQWLGPQHDGIAREADFFKNWPASGLKTLWTSEVGTGHSGISVVGERAYTCGFQEGHDQVVCLDTRTGERVWTSQYPSEIFDKMDSGGPASTPLVQEGKVFTFSRLAEVGAWEAETGKELWRFNPQKEFETEIPLFGFTASPVWADGKVVIDAGVGTAFDPTTGKVVWKTEKYKATCSTPQVAQREGHTWVAFFNAFGLVTIDAETGEKVFEKEWRTKQYDTNTATPVFVGDRVFITSGYDAGCALLQLNGKEEPSVLWRNDELRSFYNTLIPWKDHLYGFLDNNLVCIELATGEKKWSQRGVAKGCLIIVDGYLLTLSEKGELVLVEATPEGYREKGRSQNLGGTTWNLPVLAHQKLFLRNAKGKVVCLDVDPDSYR
jgi:outer membrane protein assembly factor BamB